MMSQETGLSTRPLWELLSKLKGGWLDNTPHMILFLRIAMKTIRPLILNNAS